MGAERRGRRGVRPLGTIALALVAGIAGCDAPTVPRSVAAYDPTQSTGGLVYHWTPGETIALYVDPTGVPEGYDLLASAREGAASWDGRTFYDEFRFAFVDSPAEADVIIQYRFAPPLVDLMDCDNTGGAPGETNFCPDPGDARVLPLLAGGGGHVKMNVKIDPLGPSDAVLTTAGQTRQEYVATLIAHELGHVLGIGGHSNDVGDLMFSAPRRDTPSVDDARTLRAVLRATPHIRF